MSRAVGSGAIVGFIAGFAIVPIVVFAPWHDRNAARCSRVVSHMSTIERIHVEIDELSERRVQLWHRLSEGRDSSVQQELKNLEASLEALWHAHRAERARIGSVSVSRSSSGPGPRSASSAQRSLSTTPSWVASARQSPGARL